MKFSSFVWLWSALLLTHAAAQGTDCPASPEPVRSPDSQYLCKAQGKLGSSDGFLHSNSSSGDYTYCYSYCVSDLYCQAFSYNRKNNKCSLFKQPLKTNKFKHSRSGVFYWDLNGCFHIPNTCKAFNLIPDGSFEAGVNHAPWAGSDTPVQICGELAEDGVCFGQLTVPSLEGTQPRIDLQQTISITNGTQYTFTFYYRVDSVSISGADTCLFSSGLTTENGLVTLQNNVPIANVTDGFVQSPPLLYTPDAPQPAVLFRLSCTTVASNVTLDIDNITLVKVNQ